jgi:molybdate transport system substrate-binding protein
MRPAMERLSAMYEAETGQAIDLDYGGSGQNMIKAETTGRGDLYVAHDPFHGGMMRKGLATEGWVVAYVTPMIAVEKGNPKEIGGLADLAKPGVRVVLTDPVHSSTGWICKVMFERAGLADEIEKNVVTRTRGGGGATNAVIVGHADAAIAWDAVIHLRQDKLEMVDIADKYRPDPRVDAITTATFGRIDMSRMKVTADVLASSKRPEASRAFARYLASAEAEGVWRAFGFTLAKGEKYLPPEEAEDARAEGEGGSLLMYVGAGLRPAVEEVARGFTEATGARVECDYGGSGVILSRLRLARRGDVFLPGDVWYVEQAEEAGLVAARATVCYLVPVILVRKGNPKEIGGLTDVVKEGVRLGLGNAEACQIGRVSERLFARAGVDAEAVRGAVAFSSLTVNELGVQIKAGQIDAAIVWDAIAALYPEAGEAVAIPAAVNETSEVAAAVLGWSAKKVLARRFVAYMTGEAGRAAFERHGYRTSL